MAVPVLHFESLQIFSARARESGSHSNPTLNCYAGIDLEMMRAARVLSKR